MSQPRPAPRALICTDTYPPQVNGVSVVTALSAAGLEARGWEVAVIRPSYPEGGFDPFASSGDGLHVAQETTLPSTALPGYADIRLALPAWRTVRDAIARFRPDLVHSATEFVIGRLGQREAIRRGIPVVSSYHTDFSRYTESYGVPRLRPAVRNYIGRFHRRSVRVYTPGLLAGEELHALGVSEVEVWGRGVDTDVFDPRHRSEMLRQAYGGEDSFLLVHVGRLAAEKGVERLLGGFALARQAMPDRDIRLVVAGVGPREAALRAAAPDGVSFLGNLDRRAMLPTLYASADAFLFSSHTETLGLVILEAMASGLPVIAAPAGGVADHLRDRVNGLAYPPGDVRAMAAAIAALARSPALTRELGAGARRTADAMSWRRELDRLDASYREVCARDDAPRAAREGRRVVPA
ncbi:MAG TPA: glycosyltransferase family 1 protein [Gemmatimonadales bacterium]|nr:glycosyltransferase family 1 protein [Gemmatimonadales bacterium]